MVETTRSNSPSLPSVVSTRHCWPCRRRRCTWALTRTVALSPRECRKPSKNAWIPPCFGIAEVELVQIALGGFALGAAEDVLGRRLGDPLDHLHVHEGRIELPDFFVVRPQVEVRLCPRRRWRGRTGACFAARSGCRGYRGRFPGSGRGRRRKGPTARSRRGT